MAWEWSLKLQTRRYQLTWTIQANRGVATFVQMAGMVSLALAFLSTYIYASMAPGRDGMFDGFEFLLRAALYGLLAAGALGGRPCSRNDG